MGKEKPPRVLSVIKTDPEKAVELGRRGGVARAMTRLEKQREEEKKKTRKEEENRIFREIISNEREEEELRRAERRSGANIPTDPDDRDSGYNPNEHYYAGEMPLKRKSLKKEKRRG